MTAPSDCIHVLHSVNGKHAAKQFSLAKDGSLKNRSYGNEIYFRVERISLAGFDALAETLEQITAKPFAFVVRGAPLPTANLRHTRRLLHRKKNDEPTFQPAAHHWLAIDIDHIPAPVLTDPASDPDDAIEHLIGLLPPEIHDAQTWWQFTSSQGLPGYTDTLSARLWLWGEKPYSDDELKRWASAANKTAGFPLIDLVLYSAVQAHYIAAPLFTGNLKDPLPRRWGIRHGLEATVSLLIPPPDAKDPGAPSTGGYEPGIGVEAFLAQIGGPEGFRLPIRSAIASYIATYGSKADVQPLYQRIRERIRQVEPGGDLKHYEDDNHLDDLTTWIRRQHGDQPPKGFTADPPPHIVDPEIPVEPIDNQSAAGDWYSRCMEGTDGRTLSNLANATLALRSDLAFKGLFAYDAFADVVIMLRRAPMTVNQSPGCTDPEPLYPRPLTDDDVSHTQEWLQLAGLAAATSVTVYQAIEVVARENSFHPVREYLESLEWKKTGRLDDWLSDYLGVVKTKYTMAVGRMFLISMVARVFDPGCQCDYMLILEGPQGLEKSKALRILGGKWFSDNLPSAVSSKDAKQHLRGKWLIEIPDLHIFRKSEVRELKAFQTRREDEFRPPYGRKEVYRKRQNSFGATTNEQTYLEDPTGGRRYWPVVTTDIDIDGLANARDQLFAEAVVCYRASEKWWPDREFEKTYMQPEQAARREVDAWEEPITAHIKTLPVKQTTVFRLARDALSFDKPSLGTADQRRITAILQSLGWKRAKRGPNGERFWSPDNTPDEEPDAPDASDALSTN